jgi:hypothetical protein
MVMLAGKEEKINLLLLTAHQLTEFDAMDTDTGC